MSGSIEQQGAFISLQRLDPSALLTLLRHPQTQPCQTALDLHQVAIQTGQQHLAQLAPVLVNLDPLDCHRLPCYPLDQALFGDIAECLPRSR